MAVNRVGITVPSTRIIIVALFQNFTCSVRKAMATSKGGYDCEFVTAPPKSLECPVCLLTVRDPQVVSCCGNQFCRPCIQRIRNENKPCPICNEPKFTTFLHKGVMREVNSLMVRCPQKEIGCGWEGELGQLQQHLNPGVKSSGKGCGFMLVDCIYKCGERFSRRVIHEHELEECVRRPIEVQFSSLARKLKCALVENQFLTKELGEKLDAVVAENQAIKAENQVIKAAVVENQFLNEELSEKIAAVIAENKVIKAENKAIKADNESLQETVEQLQSSCALLESCLTPIPPFYFTLNNVKHYMQEDLKWWSPHFYSHAGGYKMHFAVHPNGLGSAKGSHLSLYVSIMRGEYDHQLQWPFQGKVTIQMRESEKWGGDATINFGGAPQQCGQRPVDCDVNPAFGVGKFIVHDHLYIFGREDKIRFRVSGVDL